MQNIKLSGYRITMRFDNSVLEQNSYTAKIVHAYIIYDLDTWPKKSSEELSLKIACLV